MKWCCSIFQDFAGNAGKSGMSIFLGRVVNDRFILETRAVDFGTAPAEYLSGSPVPVAVREHRVIFHCPGCGVRLEKFYSRNLEALRRDDLLTDEASPGPGLVESP